MLSRATGPEALREERSNARRSEALGWEAQFTGEHEIEIY